MSAKVDKIERKCLSCGKVFEVYPVELKERKCDYCSVQCYQQSRYNGVGYKRKGNSDFVHRIIAENLVGHPLSSTVQIHHYGEKTDNRKIVICENQKYHRLLHKRTRAYVATGDVNKRKCVICKQWDDPENITMAKSRDYHKECNNKYEAKRKENNLQL